MSSTTSGPSLETRLGRAGVPPRYWSSTFDDFDPTRAKVAYRVATEWARTPLSEAGDRGFLLSGPPGSGKTHLLVAAIRERLLTGQSGIRFVNVPLLLDRLRAAIRWSEAEVTEDFDYLRDRANVVVLDDLGKEKATDWATERLYVLVESRYGKLLPTVASSNLSPAGLDAAGYGAIVSRLQETGPVVDLSGTADYRPAKGAR